MRLGALIRSYRITSGISLRDAASAIGTTAHTLHRVEAGKPVDGLTLRKLLFWLMADCPAAVHRAPVVTMWLKNRIRPRGRRPHTKKTRKAKTSCK